ncbi:hypothetical protein A3F07_00240 [candidate division WWE3 bacterium RIFCSPHIGHO2_12_FULL_38_15]|uniref:Putative pre-16S rRNA nuclease n=1 Tax=candidate division WWE3 bacterium RIFCSPHIGHO2_02_FULL_38_14 TaxID=1802620 RepID=A0A1F4V652_UNCKA|nr:MAG: hypothetical protein A2793_02150 [candidate division WWE3 bacterium RIFCSPHIGHO2_01_FULL_38_45]OGC49267.1 MAG: hypothetical protein A3F07_00240 [candidate division WWE3 bacterium RIFCSPHIGHO2_12_FULL_38_15]OGC52668.1 MAG: hypothetical protein A3D91_03285 [candidate division WWE3 bacterium RIFCSPHIGHO2_02_FULL_38_14]OGC53756.1 MAG: hypothetical protein A3B64_03515 [candidate division WWE3 bacterium RIFCSPLOWO2_01_FULL_37_24]HLB51301.1 Holliday junction resolvase RuvX [Patescibacteria gro
MNEQQEIILGVDYGEKTIGLALGRNGLASPLKIIQDGRDLTAVNEIYKTALINKCSKIIVGLPLSSSGKETSLSRKVRHFVKLMKVYIKTPIFFEDEFNTSKEALKEAAAIDLSRNKRKMIDHYSAALILKNYFNGKNDINPV